MDGMGEQRCVSAEEKKKKEEQTNNPEWTTTKGKKVDMKGIVCP